MVDIFEMIFVIYVSPVPQGLGTSEAKKLSHRTVFTLYMYCSSCETNPQMSFHVVMQP